MPEIASFMGLTNWTILRLLNEIGKENVIAMRAANENNYQVSPRPTPTIKMTENKLDFCQYRFIFGPFVTILTFILLLSPSPPQANAAPICAWGINHQTIPTQNKQQTSPILFSDQFSTDIFQ